ncbi:hypothetical protein CHY_0466 [Carboxydothermus hydrogenoformans Z-2901]|uniref:Uncharacterized protein n=1 Tax=Carboxydothermus hydrogenoformans (strain ATCC BAA-161 / DSM 6008 / Z-2901) TaxID=246194 RepID=Q3AEW0_CARHZ|nr:hypothetical protein CHY_0466 [Carboxydothermus hydrogenoformans Z-2901]
MQELKRELFFKFRDIYREEGIGSGEGGTSFCPPDLSFRFHNN